MKLEKCYTKKCQQQIKIVRDEAQKVFDMLSGIVEDRYLENIAEGIRILSLEPSNLEMMTKIERYNPCFNFSNFSIIKPSFFEKLNQEIEKLNGFFEKYRNKEEDDFDKKMDGFSKIQSFHNFMSIWSIYEIHPNKMKQPFAPDIVKEVEYEGLTVKVDKKVSWLEMWTLADHLIRKSGDTHHVFIESFDEDKKNPGRYKLSTGS